MTDDGLEWTTTFEWAGPTSIKVRCRVCLRTGYGPIDPTVGGSSGWQKSCLSGHPFRCLCGRRFATASGIASHTRKTSEPGPHSLDRSGM